MRYKNGKEEALKVAPGARLASQTGGLVVGSSLSVQG
jgi:hypothetical protein